MSIPPSDPLPSSYFVFFWTNQFMLCPNNSLSVSLDFFGRLGEKHKLLEILRNFSKYFWRKLLKCIIFEQNLKTLALIFCSFGRQILRKLSKIFKCFLQRIAKNALFCIFFNIFRKPSDTFSRVWKINANRLQILRKLWQFLMNIL